jgi:hypothetical protein
MAPAPAPTAPRIPTPGEGIFCAAAIYSVVNEVAQRCFPAESPDVRAALKDAVQRLDAYILENSKTTTRAQLDQFHREQGGVGAPAERLCSGESVQLYRALAGAGAEKLRSSVDAMTARKGPPTWGTCL